MYLKPGVTVSQTRYSGVTVSQTRYSGVLAVTVSGTVVSWLSQWPVQWVSGVMAGTVGQWCNGRYSGAVVVLQWRYSGAVVVLQWRYSGDSGGIEDPDGVHGHPPWSAPSPCTHYPGYLPTTTTCTTTRVPTTPHCTQPRHRQFLPKKVPNGCLE